MDAASGGYSKAQRLRRGTRDDVRAALLEGRARTLALAQAWRQALGPSLAVPYDPGLNPPVWELGHVAWFQQWWVGRNRQRSLGIRCDPDHPRPAPTLAGADAWYDSSRVAHRRRWELPLPGFDETLEWMASAQADTLRALDQLAPGAADDPLYFFRLVALHEAMHAEASCYMAQGLGITVPRADPPPVAGDAVLAIPAQRFVLGAAGPGFSFDNERHAQVVELAAFEIDAQPVGWRRFAAFADAGGYEDPSWWTEAGWRWRRQSAIDLPASRRAGGAAIHLSAHEAEAWCRWAGRRLPTEAEWECAAVVAPAFSWGQAWEWTASPFLPYAGFRPDPYHDYSQPWFGTRRVLRGASPDTSPWLADPRYRNFFEPHRRDVFAGFRSCALR